MRNRPILQMVVIGVIATAIAIPLALIIPWFPSKGSMQAGNVRTLYDVLLIATVPIFVLVETVVLFSVWKFRMRPGQEEMDGPPIHGNTRLEVVWTAVPAILIISLCTYAYTVLRSNENSKKGEMTVNVTTRQFAFEFSYPISPGKQVVSPVLYLAKDQPVVFKLRSLDVIHSFFVPNFSEKLDAVPGIVTTLRVTPTVLGTYPVECTELCGAGHSLMRTSAVVVTPAAFTKWLKSQPVNGPPPIGSPPATVPQAVPDYNVVPGAGSSSSSPSSSGASSSSSSSSSSSTSGASSSGGNAAAGKAVFTGASGCSGCHTLAAASATGTIGPDLDTRLKADCALPASQKVRGTTLQQCIETAITKPYAYLPSGYSSGIMPPNFGQRLTQTQIQDLVSFLSTAAK
ncbi:MAG TPA: cytochrome c oxidase subunit II [Solirubrobacteraceae bacterium]|nr:cytochrome c oxidase subunit II [Solirubrobacteraceae bacterium]